MANPARFWNFIAKRYARQPIADEASYQKKLDMTRAYLTPQSKVLEFGCGTGSTALLHAPYVSHILATDFSEAMISIARQKALEGEIQNVTFQAVGIDDLYTEQDTYDAVLGMNILHLVNDRLAVFEKVFGLLKPGGVFESTTPCLTGMSGFAKALLPIGAALGLLPRVSFLSSSELMGEMEKTGFELTQDWQPEPNKALFLVVRKPAA